MNAIAMFARYRRDFFQVVARVEDEILDIDTHASGYGRRKEEE
jgi:hypothetical protein